MTISTIKKYGFFSVGFLSILATIITSPPAMAQGSLEEIVVTAQRRQQSIQEVPISLEAISGAELQKQGFRVIEDLASFSPSVEVAESLHTQSLTVRGMGNNTANMSIEQSAPIFVDGIQFGRPSMTKGAFMDLERVEVLRGPQPIYFGQNATAGAISLVSRKPTPEWEGDINTEMGNFGRLSFAGGVGGPITNTLGVRLAGQWDRTKGHIRDIYDGQMYPHRLDMGGRVTLAWSPSENFNAMFKAEYAKRNSGGDPYVFCRGLSEDREFLREGEIAVLIPGLVPAYDAIHDQTPIPSCLDGFKRVGQREDFGPLHAVPGIKQADVRSGIVDVLDLARGILPDGNFEPREPMRAWNYRLGLSYEFDNGYTLESTSGMVDYWRETFEASDGSPIAAHAARRIEIFDMWSQEFRIVSPSGGPIEWSAGVYHQLEDLDLNGQISVRANVSQPVRKSDPNWGESEWKSAFATFTFNFLDNRASIDVGARYSDVHKESRIEGTAAMWIFNINPDPDGDGLIPSTDNYTGQVRSLRFRHQNPTGVIVDCAIGFVPVTTITGTTTQVTASGNICGNFGAGFYSTTWQNRDVPNLWNAQKPVALGPFIDGLRRDSGKFWDTYNEDSIDPQVTLRYRPNPNLSLYGKWARAFKGGGFDTSSIGMPDGGIGTEIGQDAFSFLAEHSENFELGAKGDLFDGQVNYNVTLFNQTIKDLQIETNVIDVSLFGTGASGVGDNSQRIQTNAGKQRTRGVEFDAIWAVSDRMTTMLAGAYMDGTMLDFIGGCTEAELANAATTDCWSVQESIDLVGDGSIAGFIDRTGEQAPRTPKWKIIGSLDYFYPVLGNYKAIFNTKAAFSAAYTESSEDFTRVISWSDHVDWNLLVGLGHQDDTWTVSAYVRNILGARQKFHPEEVIDKTLSTFYWDNLSQSAFTMYGVQFDYSFR